MSNTDKRSRCKFLLLCALTLSFMLVACGSQVGTAELFEKFEQSYADLPSGVLYSTAVPEEQDGSLDLKMMKNLYVGDGAISQYIDEGCVYLGSGIDDVGEVGIFLCKSHSDAISLSKICLARIETVKGVAKNYASQEMNEALDGAYVKIYGRYCIYSIVKDNELSEKCFDRIF